MRAGDSVKCPHCGEASVAREKKVMSGWTITGVRLVCSFCGGDLGEPEKPGAADAVREKAATDRFASLLGDGAKPGPKADLSPTADYGRFCRNCEFFLAHPFKTLCAKHDREIDPMGECPDFNRKKSEK